MPVLFNKVKRLTLQPEKARYYTLLNRLAKHKNRPKSSIFIYGYWQGVIYGKSLGLTSILSIKVLECFPL
jgi:hypothetical protein